MKGANAIVPKITVHKQNQIFTVASTPAVHTVHKENLISEIRNTKCKGK